MATDDLDRDKLYAAGADDLDCDDAELELEPPDPAVLAAEKRRAAEAIEAHRKAIDVDEVYRDLEANRDTQIVEEWLARLRNVRFRFQLRHLLILVTVVAAVLSLKVVMNVGFGTLLVVAIMLAIAGISLYLKLEENKRQEAADRRREKIYAERRTRDAHTSGQTTPPSCESSSDRL